MGADAARKQRQQASAAFTTPSSRHLRCIRWHASLLPPNHRRRKLIGIATRMVNIDLQLAAVCYFGLTISPPARKFLLPMTTTPARAAIAIFYVFLIHGLLIGPGFRILRWPSSGWRRAPRVFGLALLSIAAGAVLAMPIAGVEINRFGSRNVT